MFIVLFSTKAAKCVKEEDTAHNVVLMPFTSINQQQSAKTAITPSLTAKHVKIKPFA